jgi:hypothetical protein
MRRHFHTAHKPTRKFWCIVSGCKRSKDVDGQNRPFTRKYRLDDHVRRIHHGGTSFAVVADAIVDQADISAIAGMNEGLATWWHPESDLLTSGFGDPNTFVDPNVVSFSDLNISGFGDPNIIGFSDPNVGSFSDPTISGFGNPNVIGFIDPRVVSFGDLNIGGFGDPTGGFGAINTGDFDGLTGVAGLTSPNVVTDGNNIATNN